MGMHTTLHTIIKDFNSLMYGLPSALKKETKGEVKKMKIVIAGGTGFIGGHLAEELNKRGHDVLLLDVVEGCLEDLDFTPDFVKVDVATINDFRSIVDRGYNTLVYFAGISHTCSAGKMISENYRNGLYGLSRLLDQGGEGLDKVLIASSSLISGLLKSYKQMIHYYDDEILDVVKSNETWVDTGESYHPYVSNKIAMEMCIRDWAKLNSKKFVIARFGTTYGPRMRPGVVDDIFIRRAIKGMKEMKSLPLQVHGDGKQWRQHIYVGELVRGVVMALEGDSANNRVFYLVPEYKVSVYGMALAIQSIIPGAKIDFVDKRPLDIKVKYIDPSETHRILGWSNRLSFEEGIKLTVNWYLENPDWMPKELTEDYFSKKLGYG